jgi:hypothetical protein
MSNPALTQLPVSSKTLWLITSYAPCAFAVNKSGELFNLLATKRDRVKSCGNWFLASLVKTV